MQFDAKNHAEVGDYPEVNMKTCGLSKFSNSITPRIVDGEKANLGEFPWMASIIGTQHFGGDIEPVVYYCGGAILNQYWILTAALCFNHKRYKKLNTY